MRIVIDCFKLVKGAGKSIGIYNLSLNLVKNLVASKDTMEDEKIRNSELIILGNQYNQEDFDIQGVKFLRISNYNPLSKIHCIIWELFAVSMACKKLKADRIVFPRGFCALTHPAKDIVIIHDMIPFYYHEHYPDYFNKLENAYIMNRLKASARSCNRIITISEASKKEIMKYCKVNENRICVIHNGCNEITIEKDSSLIDEKQYIFAITSKLPHKNAQKIFEAYKKYCEISDEPLKLKVVGVEDTIGIEFPEDIKTKISCYKYVENDDELHAIMRGAKVFLFLSFVEGFGFPPIEAMQLGVPVICSNRSSLPEIVGSAAILLDPENIDEIAYEINRIDEDFSKSSELVRLGYKNIERFYWNTISPVYWKELIR